LPRRTGGRHASRKRPFLGRVSTVDVAKSPEVWWPFVMSSWTPAHRMLAALVIIAAGVLASVSELAAGPGAPGDRSVPAWRGVVLVLSPEGEQDDLMLQVETAGSDLDPVAAFAIVRDPGAGAGGIAVWVSNRLSRMTTVQHVRLRSADADRAATQLAVETVELVRANIVGLRPEPASAAKSKGSPDLTPDRGAAGPRLGVAIGVAVFDDFGGVPASWAPTLALSYGASDRLELRLTAVGLGPGTDVTTGDGTGARLQRQLWSAGVLRRFRTDRSVQFMLSAAVGAHRLSADGTGAPPDRQHSLSSYAAALSVGAGAGVSLAPHLALTVETEALGLSSTAKVVVSSSDVGRLNRAALFVHGGLLATF
jgi:hypothetical protein